MLLHGPKLLLFFRAASSASGSEGSSGPVSIAYTDRVLDDTDKTGTTRTYTFSGRNFGTVSADRIMICCVLFPTNSANVVSSMTIGGVTAVEQVRLGSVAIWTAVVPTNANTDVVCNNTGPGGSTSYNAIALFSMTGAQGGTAFDTGSTSTNAADVAVDVPANGASLGFIGAVTLTHPAIAWSANFPTEAFDEQIQAASNDWAAAIHQATSGATENFRATVSNTGGQSVVYASWGPNQG